MFNTIAPPCSQGSLFNLPKIINAHNVASARNAYGNAAQEIVCSALGLTPIPINGNFSTCFDAYKDGEYYEIKSVKRNGKLVIYDWRAEKEEAAGVTLHYAILIHSIRSERTDIIQKMTDAPLSLIVVPMSIVHMAAQECSLRVHKPNGYSTRRPGFNRLGYIRGYRNLSVKEVLKHCGEWEEIPNPFGGVIRYAAQNR